MKISLGNRNNHHEIDPLNMNEHEEMSLGIEWNEFARKVCKLYEENKKIDQQVLNKIEEEDDDEYDEENDDDEDEESDEDIEVEKLPINPKEQEKSTKKPIPTTKAPKEKTSVKPKNTTSAPPSIIDSGNENDESEGDDDYDYEEEEKEDESIKDDDRDEKIKNLIDGENVINRVVNGILGKIKM